MNKNEFAAFTRRVVIIDKTSVSVKFRVSLGNCMPFFLKCREVTDFIRNFAFMNDAERSFYKTVIVDACIRRQGCYQTNVRTLWRFNRADAAIVGGVNVTNLETGPSAERRRLWVTSESGLV
jgi:hypothetical protein